MECRPARFPPVLFLLLIVSTASTLPTDPDFAQGKACWLAHDYQGAYRKLSPFRPKPYGRRADVDFMLAACACKPPGPQNWGRSMLGWPPYGYPLSSQDRVLVSQQLSSCGDPGSGNPALSLASIAAGMRGIGKGHWDVFSGGDDVS